VDTAPQYTNGTSERIVGELIAADRATSSGTHCRWRAPSTSRSPRPPPAGTRITETEYRQMLTDRNLAIADRLNQIADRHVRPPLR
jgi:aryl-alcohol dehydrogenase-like predicted oxidoreductase